MTERTYPAEKEKQFAFFMDLLGHDILNNNQAVLGYLELLLATPGADRVVKRYAEKAVSHVRTSTILVDNIKRLLATRAADPDSFKPIDLYAAINLSERELVRMYPDKSIKVRIAPAVEKAFVIGNNAARDLIMNAVANIVRLDQGDEVELSIKLKEAEYKGKMCWRISLEDPTAQLPPALKGRDFESIYLQDSSTAVKLSGLLFAKMICENLGGDFDVRELPGKGQKKGVAFVMTLRKASGP